MNYFFQMTGLRKNGANGVFDYSDAALPTLTESSLDETVGLNAGAAFAAYGTKWVCSSTGMTMVTDAVNSPIDWDCDGNDVDPMNGDFVGEPSVSTDVNDDGLTIVPLAGHDDWGNLDFKGGTIGTGVPLPQPQTTEAEELDAEINEEVTQVSDPLEKVKGHVSKRKLHLTWKPAKTDDPGVFYRIYRSEDGGESVLIGTSTESNFDDLNVVEGVGYVYSVTWVDSLGIESAPSEEIELQLK